MVTDYSGERCDPLVKVCCNHVLLAGFAGDFETILEGIRLVEGGETDPRIIAKIGVEGLIVKDGRILLLDSKRVWKRPKRVAFYATGSGSSTALAFLSGRLSKKPGSKLTEDDITATFKFVAKARTDCGSKFDYVE
jgi:hypothetical protein